MWEKEERRGIIEEGSRTQEVQVRKSFGEEGGEGSDEGRRNGACGISEEKESR